MGAIIVNLSITLPLAKILNTWIDESYTLRTTGQTLQYAIHQAIHFELQPPLYFALLTLWRSFDHSIFFARLFSVICAALLVYCAAQVSARYVPGLNPAWAAWFVALNPATIWAAEEIRVYALGGLLSALLMWTFYDGYLAERASSRARIVHAVVAIISLYTQYFLSFVLLAQFCALLVTRRWTTTRYFVLAMLVVGAFGLPIAYILHQQIAAGTSTYFSTESLYSLVLDIYGIAFYYVLPLSKLITAMGISHAIRYLVLLGVVAAVAVVFVLRKTGNRPNALNAWTIAIVTCVALALAFKVTKEPFGFRYMFVAFAPIMTAALVTLGDLQRRFRYVVLIWMAVFIVGSLPTLFSTYQPLAKGGDWIRVAAFLESAEEPNQPILAFQTENAMSLDDYYRGRNVIVAVPRPIDFTVAWNEAQVVQTDRDVEQDIASVPGRHPYIWVVNTTECQDFSVDYHCPIFEHFLEAHYTVVVRRQFFRSQARLLRLRDRVAR
ncbi:MAG TPA: hypothetical protein VGW96_02085 [Candidatus Eremiobacteraceae bacterium]|nr:hypothetical protein [Candidatus Eremiobacteraceae bacterium]